MLCNVSVASSCGNNWFRYSIMNNLVKMKYNIRYIQLSKCTAYYFKVPKVFHLLQNSRLFDLGIKTHFCTVASYKNLIINTKLNDILKVTSDMNINEKTVVNIFETNPELLNVPSITWNEVLSILLSSGFTGNESLQMISLCPKLLKTESKTLQEALDCWRRVKLGESNVLSLIISCPELLYVNLKDLPRKITVLKSLGSNKNVLSVLRTCPNVAFESCSTLIQKVEYIENEMKISPDKLLKCQALGRSLYELKARHVFLERAGKYIPPNPKKDVKEFSTNPSLKQITDTDDLKFATSIAGLTLEEYEFFVDIYRTEENESDTEDEYH